MRRREKKSMKVILTLLLMTLSFQALGEDLTPSSLLKEVYSQNPELSAERLKAESEKAAVSSKYSLSNPRLGFMRETNMTSDQQQMGAMDSFGISQEVMFPTKYFSMGSMQKSKASALNEEYLNKKLELRQKALTQYYGYYAATQIAALLEAQKETLREIARIAEARRATGASPQQDEMKAHVEQTKIENEILLQKQEVVELEASLRALLNRDRDFSITLPKEELNSPKLIESLDSIEEKAIANSKMLSSQKAWLEEAETGRTLAKMNYLPDFMLSYRKPFGNNAPSNAYVVGIEMSVPLWFFTKQNSETAAASKKALEAEKRVEMTKRQVESETKSLSHKAETLSKLLQIYETALIPQSTSALNSSRSAYSAGKVGFQELLDAERSLYSVRIDYYKNLSRFVEALTSLERIAGASVSTLPMDEENLSGGI